MAKYRLIDPGIVVRDDGACIPDDPANLDRQEFNAWQAAGGVADLYLASPESRMVKAQDLMEQFTAADIDAIQTATASDSSKLLLWYSFLAQGSPMDMASARFQAGWSALVDILGQPRMSQIATALNIAA